MRRILADLSVYDWFILKRILKNVNSQKFNVILQQVSEAILQAKSGGGMVDESNGAISVIELQPINSVPS